MHRRLGLAVEHHDSFIAAIAAHDEETMIDLVFDHWELSREEMERSIAPQGLKADAFITRIGASKMEKLS